MKRTRDGSSTKEEDKQEKQSKSDEIDYEEETVFGLDGNGIDLGPEQEIVGCPIDPGANAMYEISSTLLEGDDDAIKKLLLQWPKGIKLNETQITTILIHAKFRGPEIFKQVQELCKGSSSQSPKAQLDISPTQPVMPGVLITQTQSTLNAQNWVADLYGALLEFNPITVNALLDKRPPDLQISASDQENLEGLSADHPEVQERIKTICQQHSKQHATTDVSVSGSTRQTTDTVKQKPLAPTPSYASTTAQTLPRPRPVVPPSDGLVAMDSFIAESHTLDDKYTKDLGVLDDILTSQPYQSLSSGSGFTVDKITHTSFAEEWRIEALAVAMLEGVGIEKILDDWLPSHKIHPNSHEIIRSLLPRVGSKLESKILPLLESNEASNRSHTAEESKKIPRLRPIKQTQPPMSEIEQKLYDALDKEQHQIVKDLLDKHGAEINFTCDRGALLKKAFEMADEEEKLSFTKQWLSADVSLANDWHVAVLVMAVEKENMLIIEELIKDGRALEADKQQSALITAVRDNWELNILMKLIVAPKYQQNLNINVLLSHAEDAEAFDIADYLQRIREVCGVTSEGIVVDTSKISSVPKFRPEIEELKTALKNNDPDSTKRLQETLYQQLKEGYHPLLLNIAAPYNTEVTAKFIKDMLLKHELSSHYVNLVLLSATSSNNISGVKVLLMHPHADPTDDNVISDCTALSLAVRHECAEILELLLQHVKKIQKLDEIDYAGLMKIADQHKNPKVLELLKAWGFAEEQALSDQDDIDVGAPVARTDESALIAETIIEYSFAREYGEIKKLFVNNKGTINLSYPSLIESVFATGDNALIECLFTELELKRYQQNVYDTVFMRAASNGNAEALNKFIAMPQFQNIADRIRVQALLESIQNKQPKTLEILMSQPAIKKHVTLKTLLDHMPKEVDEKTLAMQSIIDKDVQAELAPKFIQALIKGNEDELCALFKQHSHELDCNWGHGRLSLIATAVGGQIAQTFIANSNALPRKPNTEILLQCLKTAIRHRNLDLCKVFLAPSMGLSSDQIHQAAFEAAKLGELECLQLLMTQPNIDSSIDMEELGLYGARHDKIKAYIKTFTKAQEITECSSNTTTTSVESVEQSLYKAIYKGDNKAIPELLTKNIDFTYKEYIILDTAFAFRVNTLPAILERYHTYTAAQHSQEKNKHYSALTSIAACRGHTSTLLWLSTSNLLPTNVSKTKWYMNAAIANNLNSMLFLALCGNNAEQENMLEYTPAQFKSQISDFINATHACLANNISKDMLLNLWEPLKQQAALRQVCKEVSRPPLITVLLENAVPDKIISNCIQLAFASSAENKYKTQPAELFYKFNMELAKIARMQQNMPVIAGSTSNVAPQHPAK
ncbi:MAG: hypothetical protein JSS50_03570 [Proteobacteria bacterium]|nr:hypothetical protein [Pseudomonadota bacterium]